MPETKKTGSWQKAAFGIGQIIRDLSRKHPEMKPLLTSFINFSRKCGIAGCRAGEGMEIVSKKELLRLHDQISRQKEEIEALEYRIKTLLERP